MGPEGVRQQRRRASRRIYRRRQIAAAVALVVLIALAWLALTSLHGSSPTRATSHPTTTARSSTTSAAPTTTAATTTTDPGLLPQTSAEPPSDGPSLTARLSGLWTAIQDDSLPTGMTVFFPETAYLKMKTGILPNPSADYASRLVAFYGLDLTAYQQAVGPQASTATLVGAVADAAYAAWIPPGSCENSVGYWHLPNVRLVYSTAGTVRSFGVASLISWSGVWYVVHLGPNPRPSNVGTVDQPATGPGTPGPPGGC